MMYGRRQGVVVGQDPLDTVAWDGSETLSWNRQRGWLRRALGDAVMVVVVVVVVLLYNFLQ
jgi:hypothetical protein